MLAFTRPLPDPALAHQQPLPQEPGALIFHPWDIFFFFFFPCFDCLGVVFFFFLFILLRSLGQSSPGKVLRLGFLFTIEARDLIPGGKAQAWAGHGAVLGEGGPRPSHDAVGEVLEAIVELGGDGAHAAVHHLLDEELQLLLRHVHVEPLLQVPDGGRAVETGELRPCRWGRNRAGDGGTGASAAPKGSVASSQQDRSLAAGSEAALWHGPSPGGVGVIRDPLPRGTPALQGTRPPQGTPPGTTKPCLGEALGSLDPCMVPRGQDPALRPAAPLTLLHDLHDLHDFIHVLPGSDETLQHQHLVVVEHVPVQPAHHLEGRGGVGGPQPTEKLEDSSVP